MEATQILTSEGKLEMITVVVLANLVSTGFMDQVGTGLQEVHSFQFHRKLEKMERQDPTE